MQRNKPTKQDMIDQLQRIQARDGQVSQSVFKEETGWDKDWFYNHWPETGYAGACEEAGVSRGAVFGKETNLRLSDEDVASRLAATAEKMKKFPTLTQFRYSSRIGKTTILRGEIWQDARRRLIRAYLSLPGSEQRGEAVEKIMSDELHPLESGSKANNIKPTRPIAATPAHTIRVPETYVENVREFRDRGEEEQRQLVVRLFVEVLGYRRTRIRSEHQHNDVRVHDRRNKPWLVVEVEPSLQNDREKRAARRQGFDYAHRAGLRFVVISDGDYFEIYDRCAGEGLKYDEMKQGSFHLSSLRSRDDDLLSLLASER